MARSISTNHIFGLKTGSVFFAMNGLDLVIMSLQVVSSPGHKMSVSVF